MMEQETELAQESSDAEGEKVKDSDPDKVKDTTASFSTEMLDIQTTDNLDDGCGDKSANVSKTQNEGENDDKEDNLLLGTASNDYDEHNFDDNILDLTETDTSGEINRDQEPNHYESTKVDQQNGEKGLSGNNCDGTIDRQDEESDVSIDEKNNVSNVSDENISKDMQSPTSSDRVDEKEEPIKSSDRVDEKDEPITSSDRVDEKDEPITSSDRVDEKDEPMTNGDIAAEEDDSNGDDYEPMANGDIPADDDDDGCFLQITSVTGGFVAEDSQDHVKNSDDSEAIVSKENSQMEEPTSNVNDSKESADNSGSVENNEVHECESGKREMDQREEIVTESSRTMKVGQKDVLQKEEADAEGIVGDDEGRMGKDLGKQSRSDSNEDVIELHEEADEAMDVEDEEKDASQPDSDIPHSTEDALLNDEGDDDVELDHKNNEDKTSLDEDGNVVSLDVDGKEDEDGSKNSGVLYAGNDAPFDDDEEDDDGGLRIEICDVRTLDMDEDVDESDGSTAVLNLEQSKSQSQDTSYSDSDFNSPLVKRAFVPGNTQEAVSESSTIQDSCVSELDSSNMSEKENQAVRINSGKDVQSGQQYEMAGEADILQDLYNQTSSLHDPELSTMSTDIVMDEVNKCAVNQVKPGLASDLLSNLADTVKKIKSEPTDPGYDKAYNMSNKTIAERLRLPVQLQRDGNDLRTDIPQTSASVIQSPPGNSNRIMILATQKNYRSVIQSPPGSSNTRMLISPPKTTSTPKITSSLPPVSIQPYVVSVTKTQPRPDPSNGQGTKADANNLKISNKSKPDEYGFTVKKDSKTLAYLLKVKRTKEASQARESVPQDSRTSGTQTVESPPSNNRSLQNGHPQTITLRKVSEPNSPNTDDSFEEDVFKMLQRYEVKSVDCDKISEFLQRTWRKKGLKTYKGPRPPEGLKMDNKCSYPCTECGDTFAVRSSLDFHSNRKSMRITFDCSDCKSELVFTNKCQLLAHMRRHRMNKGKGKHNSALKINSDNISILTPSMDDITSAFEEKSKSKTTKSKSKTAKDKEASDSSSDFTVSVCDESSTVTDTPPVNTAEKYVVVTATNSTKTLSTNPSKSFSCPICFDTSVKNEDLLRLHFGFHDVICSFAYKCTVCPQVLPRECSLKAHMSTHMTRQTVNQFICPECGKVFPKTDYQLYKKHLDSCFHDNRVCLLECPCCRMKIPGIKNMKQHLVQIHANYFFRCSTCKLVFNSLAKYNTHTLQNHPGVVFPRIPEDKYVLRQCGICRDVPAPKEYLEKHMDRHIPELKKNAQFGYVCLKCTHPTPTVCFNTKQLLFEHMVKFHGLHECRKHRCHECGLTFATPVARLAHFNSSHEQAKEPGKKVVNVVYRCAKCNATCLTAAHLRKHECNKVLKNDSSVVGMCTRCGTIVPTNQFGSHKCPVSTKKGETTPTTFQLLTKAAPPATKNGQIKQLNTVNLPKPLIQNPIVVQSSQVQKSAPQKAPPSQSAGRYVLTQKGAQSQPQGGILPTLKAPPSQSPGGYVPTTGMLNSFVHKCFGCGEILASKEILQNHLPKCTYRTPSKNWESDTQHSCNYCSVRFPSLKRLMFHVAEHNKKGLHVCGNCKIAAFTTLEQLDNHSNICTGTPADIIKCICRICNKGLNAGEKVHHLATHVAEFKLFCPCCMKIDFTHRRDMLSHVSECGNPLNHGICYVCHKVITNVDQLVVHLQEHVERKILVCVRCQKRDFRTEKQLEEHHERCGWVMAENMQVCTLCHEEFPGKDSQKLYKHLTMHVVKGVLICCKCQKMGWKNHGHMKSHQISCGLHADPDSKLNKLQKLQCRKCHLIFKTVKHLQTHQNYDLCGDMSSDWYEQKKQSSPLPAKVTKEKTGYKTMDHFCEHCGKKFSKFNDLQDHVEKEHVSFPCHLCGLAYDSKSELQSHIKLVHDGKRSSFTCEVCHGKKIVKQFASELGLSLHMQKVHKRRISHDHEGKDENEEEGHSSKTQRSASPPPVKRLRVDGDSMYTCAKCSYSSQNEAEFADHVKQHNKEGSIQCQDCGLCFSIVSALKKHLFMVHKIRDADKYLEGKGLRTEEEEFDSEAEDQSPSIKQAKLLQHVQVTESSEEEDDVPENPLECSVCHRSFKDQRELKTHMRIHGMAFIRSKRKRKRKASTSKTANPPPQSADMTQTSSAQVYMDIDMDEKSTNDVKNDSQENQPSPNNNANFDQVQVKLERIDWNE